MIQYFQHNLGNTNVCVFTHEAKVCNPEYKLVAKFVIKYKWFVIKKKPYLPTVYNIDDRKDIIHYD